MKKLADLLKERVLVLDGAMGTFIQKYNLRKFDYHKSRFQDHNVELFGFHEILNLTYPDLIKEIHEKYLKAGADIIETNTIRANEFYLAKYELQGLSYEINLASAKIAREIATKYSLIRRNRPRFVFGSVGPVEGELDPEAAKQIYSQQLKGLIAGKVDAIVFESFTSARNLEYALAVLNEILEKRNRSFDVVLSATVAKRDGKIFLTGDFLRALREKYNKVNILAAGENCGIGPEEVLRDIRVLSKDIDLPVIAYPNTGTDYDEPYSAAQFAAIVKRFLDEQLVNIIGGCCGTTPEYTELIDKLAKNAKPRSFSF